MTDTTVTTEAPPSNTPEARAPDGTLKDQSTGSLLDTGTKTETKPEVTIEEKGDSFLTGKKEEPKADAKIEEPKPDADKDKATDAPAGAPEKYEAFKLPDGYTLDEKVTTEVQGVFKDLNLTQEQGQKLMDLYGKAGLEATTAPLKAWADLQKTWVGEIQDRFGSKAEEVRTDISKAISAVLPPSLQRSFRTALDLTGAGSNPDIVEGLHILLKPFTEGGSIKPGGMVKGANEQPGKAQPSIAEALYPHLANNRT